ncbi:diguanylate cyclase [Gordonia sp. OPL2]|uniref:GGDEF domain-containing protein n=1 Tax=Gordonia sp. OPL2 TaxID=2486274 RepID=UPI001655BD4E|nr:GGDEF domain-containing protein [Gordonia sp. OPL2]ROZ86285.1 GGDEF domain-containing protein [Gordonia sp. OPL2]
MYLDEYQAVGAGNLRGDVRIASSQAYDEPDHVLGQIEISERLPRYGIAGLTLAFGLMGLLSTLSPDGSAGSPLRIAAIVAISATTIPVAIVVARVNLSSMWWSKKAAIRGINTAFVVYADVGVTAALCTFQNPAMALHGTALFAVIGGYVAHFVRARTAIYHGIFTTVVIIGCGIATWAIGLSWSSALYSTLISLAAANGILGLLCIYSTESQRALRIQLESANTDPLTGVLNRRGFRYRATSAVRRNSSTYATAVVDIDNYKQINDQYGHATGDAVLARVAAMLVDVVGTDGVVGRLGGDEFAIGASIDREAMIDLAERIRDHDIEPLDGRRITMSTGAVVHDERARTGSRRSADAIVTESILAADRALFDAKKAGRNTFRIASTLVSSGQCPS